MIVENWEWGILKYVAFIDLEKAFSIINRNNLWRILHQDSKIITVIKSIYENTESKVKNKEMVNEWFNIKTGVKQEGVLSPLFFIIYMDRCLKEVYVLKEEITLVYADEIAFVRGKCEDPKRTEKM
uniref:Reverse transcriptase domain-containing protein n=1 Tax=Scylla olivacea TaxID=85551 RepID=A0A0P4WIA0_SCYOL